ncbi:hypothetical protein SAMN04487970_102713 [Paenibacillus tianmuensis]|uniref:Uncharacterized protein n=1 Tax=Paenibacillus tianmuensis TaxID=624147 RepID=A0A1G4SEB9_9BACL|nr:hypothetical protein SAMN04487970_102713 [Paenibacillus tianmuensis]
MNMSKFEVKSALLDKQGERQLRGSVRTCLALKTLGENFSEMANRRELVGIVGAAIIVFD